MCLLNLDAFCMSSFKNIREEMILNLIKNQTKVAINYICKFSLVNLI